MKILRPISKIMMVLLLCLTIYDYSVEWFLRARIKIRNLQEFWGDVHGSSLSSGKAMLSDIFGSAVMGKLMTLPAPLALLPIPVFLYAVYWIIFKLRGGNDTGAMKYKSHD